MGRVGLYDTKVQPRLTEIAEWIQTMTERQIASKLGIGYRTFCTYKAKHADLQRALANGKDELVVELKSILKKKALGYYYKETKTYIKDEDGKKVRIVEETERYAHPDTGAIHLLLKNLDESWRNDDQTTVDLKRERLALERDKEENKNW